MRELTVVEAESVSGGAGLIGLGMMAAGGLGLLASIPVIVGGAILGVPTLGLGFVAMAGGIVGTALSGAGMIAGLVLPV